MTTSRLPKLKKNAQDTYGHMIEFLLLNDWEPEKLPDVKACRATFVGSNKTKMSCYAEVRPDEKFIFFIIAPIITPLEKRLAVAEYIIRINFYIRIGGFVLNFETGEALFKTGIDFTGTTLDVQHIENAILLAAMATDKYWPGIQWVATGAKTPEEAVKQIRS